jgi:hypothetical protein
VVVSLTLLRTMTSRHDTDFLAAFLDARLGPADFDHRGHLRAAWLLLHRHPLPEAIAQTCTGIARLATRLGATDKYHHTVTEALVRLIAAADAAAPARDFAAFLARHPALVDDARGLLARHYSAERLADPAARVRWVAPDRLPLPAPTAADEPPAPR